jgi:hypothetical protein
VLATTSVLRSECRIAGKARGKMASDADTPCLFDCADTSWSVNARRYPSKLWKLPQQTRSCIEAPGKNHTLRLNGGPA